MKRNNHKRDNTGGGSGIPENNPSKAMDSKREVEQSDDAKTDQDFPGYPHYPAKEDIMDQRTDSHRVDLDVENLASGRNATGVSQRFINEQERKASNRGSLQDSDEDELNVSDSRDEETGIPQNVSNEDLGKNRAGSNLEEDAGKDR